MMLFRGGREGVVPNVSYSDGKTVASAVSRKKVYVPPGHKVSCNSRLGRDMYSPDSIGSYIFPKQLAMCGNLRRWLD